MNRLEAEKRGVGGGSSLEQDGVCQHPPSSRATFTPFDRHRHPLASHLTLTLASHHALTRPPRTTHRARSLGDRPEFPHARHDRRETSALDRSPTTVVHHVTSSSALAYPRPSTVHAISSRV
ncbi:hypothetical protein K523DRAFT_358900 [Schizophyllum commune Tattone D]|nr:hypothetical protein K523DRAFT_358900 [Schizophyllum commune Tattone D]